MTSPIVRTYIILTEPWMMFKFPLTRHMMQWDSGPNAGFAVEVTKP